MAAPEYALGHSDSEVRRLELQASLLAPGTERVLRAAGLRPGMSVLDIGTGAGDVAMQAAALVGPTGSVLGIDRESSVLERARARAEAAGLGQVRYETATLETLPADRSFDAVVGRYVLHHQVDRVACLLQAAARVRSGGILVFMEPTIINRGTSGESWSFPPVPLYEETCDLFVELYERIGMHLRTGAELVWLFYKAGLPEPTLLRDVPTMGPTSTAVEWVSLVVRSLLPAIERHGVATAAEIEVETLQARLQAAVSSAHSQLRIDDLVGAWVTIREHRDRATPSEPE